MREGIRRLILHIILSIIFYGEAGSAQATQANCAIWLKAEAPATQVTELPHFFPQDLAASSMLSELILIHHGMALLGQAKDFAARAAYAQKVTRQRLKIDEHLQWVMAQSLVAAAAAYWKQRGIRYRLGQELANHHTLSYLELLPTGKSKANQAAARVARKYQDLRFVYHPYHLINQHLDAAYEVTYHQIYLGHNQVKNFNLRDLDLLHELRHARRNNFLAQKIPSAFYGISTTSFPGMMNYSVYQRHIMHDEPLEYFAELKSLIYRWKRAWHHGLWRKQKLLRGQIINYAGQAYLISSRIREMAQFWPSVLAQGQGKVVFYYSHGITAVQLTLERDGHIQQTKLPLLLNGNLQEEQKREALYHYFQRLADGGRHYQEIFALIKHFFSNFDDTKFSPEAFQQITKVLQQPHPH